MKKILLTWYGITDLKAAFGVEYSNGPVLSALTSDEYSDVIILGYTNKEKNNVLKNKDFNYELLEAQKAFKDNKQAEIWGFINTYSNTNIAHSHFINWLKVELEKTNIQTKVDFHYVELAHLNDTEGIYNIATDVLDMVASWQEDKEIFFYLSPGTPVMAFVWAFAALRYPHLNKKLLASPIMNKKPEIVSLPKEWLEWHSNSINEEGKHFEKYDVIFHLFGEQRMPSLLGIKQFQTKKHVFVNSKQYPANVMKHFLNGADFAELSVEPFNPLDTKNKILEYLKNIPKDAIIGFNLTGGTKLMYAGALAACKKINATPFYFDIIHDKLIFINDFETMEIKPITSVETFIKLHSDNLFISKKGYWSDIKDINNKNRTKLTQLLWKFRAKIAKLYKDIIPYVNNKKSFFFQKSNISIRFSEDYNVEITIDDESFSFTNWKDFPIYITGGWFEEYTYMQFQPLVEKGIIYDLRIGLEIGFKERTNISNMSGLENLKNIFGETYQEFDITFTDGKKLFIVECKAGNIKSEHIMKLQNITNYFGGLKGQGILASCFPPNNKILKKKLQDSKNISLVSGKHFSKEIISLF